MNKQNFLGSFKRKRKLGLHRKCKMHVSAVVFRLKICVAITWALSVSNLKVMLSPDLSHSFNLCFVLRIGIMNFSNSWTKERQTTLEVQAADSRLLKSRNNLLSMKHRLLTRDSKPLKLILISESSGSFSATGNSPFTRRVLSKSYVSECSSNRKMITP